ncbi:MAG: hypothetical protein HYX54_01110 [Chloroflexi bacterium]|nr:hypothetical protein [Chloroflexota bacterium]
MDGLIALLLGVAAFAGAVGVLRAFGSRLRVGRLLGSTPLVTVAEAVKLAREAVPTYVRVSGRIDSEAEFEDANHRPLVYRRTRFQAQHGQTWRDFDAVTEAVPFEINEGLDHIQVDGSALAEGLVVVLRETTGSVGDLGDRAPDELDDALPARVIVEQVSSVEHAEVLGVPALRPDGSAHLTAGLGRPLILSTLEQPEAMRILAGGSVAKPRLAAGLLAVAAVLVVLGIVLLILPGSALAASPVPTPVGVSDTRSTGQGPGLTGAPLAAILGVLGIGLLALLVTLVFVRLTGGNRGSRADR